MTLYGYDYTLMLVPVLLCMVLGMVAQGMIRSRFTKYSAVRAACSMTGAQMAQDLLARAGVAGVSIHSAQGGPLSDHFNPKTNALHLSQGVYDEGSIAALAVAAHEAGHAMQYAQGYAFIRIRNALAPVVNITSQAVWLLVVAGMVLSLPGLSGIGVVIFGITVLFQFVTLPVEIDASRRALRALETGGYLTQEEMPGARKVLTAAAMTYVAAALTSVVQLLRLLAMSRRGSSKR